jgi:1-acyl-sn-glycerol-3-phosphate acyltransferase
MFPPIMRAPKKKPFNTYALDRVAAELRDQGVIIGFHPEGTRNKELDHTKLLSARPGIGQVIQNTPEATIIPVFIAGPTNRVFREFCVNWFAAKKNPVVVFYGAPIKADDLNQLESTREVHQQIADRCMEHIQMLSEEYRVDYEDIYSFLKRA